MRIQLDHLSLYFNNTSSAPLPRSRVEKRVAPLARALCHTQRPTYPFINTHMADHSTFAHQSLSLLRTATRGEKELKAARSPERKEMGTLVECRLWPAAEKNTSCAHLPTLYSHTHTAFVHDIIIFFARVTSGRAPELSKAHTSEDFMGIRSKEQRTRF
jgi:hypothetical protein